MVARDPSQRPSSVGQGGTIPVSLLGFIADKSVYAHCTAPGMKLDKEMAAARAAGI